MSVNVKTKSLHPPLPSMTIMFRLWCDYESTTASLVTMAQKTQILQALVVLLFTMQCVPNFVGLCVFLPQDHSRCHWYKWRVWVFQACGLPTVDLINVCVCACVSIEAVWVEVKRVLLSLSSPVSFTADACLHLGSAERSAQLLFGWNVHRCWHHSVNSTGPGVVSGRWDVRDCSRYRSSWLTADSIFLRDILLCISIHSHLLY